MVAKKKSKASKAPAKKRAVAKTNGIKHVKLSFGPANGPEMSFTRADLIFTGIDHSDMSYEVRVFLNNRKADDTTSRTPESGYAGRFVIFGHGRCLGEDEHCDAQKAVRTSYDPVRQHPVTPQKQTLTITDSLLRILSQPGRKLETITLVPISKNARRKDRGIAANLFKYDSLSIETYR